MSRRFALAFLSLLPAAAFFVPKVAHAGLESCGNINVKADAKCEVHAKGGCTAQCTPLTVKAACQAKAVVSCDGECSGSIDASCTGSCSGSCSASCSNVTAGSFSCTGSCEGSCNTDCESTCQAQASGGTASANCKANCQANCSAKCSAQCEGTPPNASCDAKCGASCKGSCQAKATGKCQVDCQAKISSASCEAEVQGGCTAACEKPEGAIFCDGQYVDSGGNLEKCAAALNAILNLKFDATASADCGPDGCHAEASAKASACSTTMHGPSNPPLAPGAIVLGAIGAVIARRMRRGSSASPRA
jgi:hypothetical protein